jgi:SAM-dependent methyltransferase
MISSHVLPRLNYKNLTPMQTVEAIYQLLLGRSVDPAGKATWMQAIEGNTYSRWKQLSTITSSDEFLISFDSISRPERLRRTLSMLSLLKMEHATPAQQSEMVYRFILNRKIDASGMQACADRSAKGQFSALGLVARLMRSAEFKQPYRKLTPTQQLHYARMAWAGQLPAAKRVLDIGGSSPTMPEGALIELGFAHKPETLIIFDKPPNEQFWGTPNYSQANTRSFPWGQVQYIHGYAEDILQNDELRDQKFDMIYMGQVVEHIYEDKLPTVLAWIKNHLAPGGRFCFDTPNRLITRCQMGEDHYIDPDHKREYTPEAFAALVTAAGFSIVQQWGILDMPNVAAKQSVGVKDYYDGAQLAADPTHGYCFAMMCQ